MKRGGTKRAMGGALSLDFSRPAAVPPTPPRKGGITNPTGSRLSSASSQEVLRQLDRDEEIVFRAVHGQIAEGTPRISRLERFQEWMQENPSRVREILDARIARSSRRLEREATAGAARRAQASQRRQDAAARAIDRRMAEDPDFIPF